MNRSHTTITLLAFFLCLLALAQTCGAAQPAQESPILRAMTEELQRSFTRLEHAEEAPLYYLGYSITHTISESISASAGAVTWAQKSEARYLDVDLRVGSPKLDNTHEIRGSGYDGYGDYGWPQDVPIEDDPDAIKAALWQQTDRLYKEAQERLINVKANLQVKVEEEHKADDFSASPPVHLIEELAPFPDFDREAWKAKLRDLSARLLAEPYILSADAAIQVEITHRFMVNNEGTRFQVSHPATQLHLSVSAVAADGMDLSRYETYQALSPDGLPDDKALEAAADRLVAEIRSLYNAPVVEPYHGPAILMNRAAAVFFHEIFGHRIEGHRQKMSEEGQTFTKKVGEKILPDFLSVYDDPTQKEFRGKVLMGYYPVDEEGVASQRVTVVEDGILRNFLMSRSPIEGFGASNGHGRREPGSSVVSRQGNLMIESEKSVPFDELRRMLIAECTAQNKPYGLIFDDISGGFTMTERYYPQAFKVIPLLVRRVYTDGRPDEVVRGVDIVGTPLASFSKIAAAGDDPDIFNGMCGAESGMVPVSAVSPSLLLGEIEVEKQEKSQEKPPILPPPAGTAESTDPSEVIFKALSDEMSRGASELKMEGTNAPYYLEYTLKDHEGLSIEASFGALVSRDSGRMRNLSVDVRVGDYSFDNTNFGEGGYDGYYGSYGGYGAYSFPVDDDYEAMRRAAWLQTDYGYKQAVSDYAAKEACIKNRKITDRPPDMSREKPVVHMDDPAKLDISPEEWTQTIKDLSAMFREFPWVQSSSAELAAAMETQYFVNSEGFKHRRSSRGYAITVSATAQAEDGMKLSDGFKVSARHPDELPTPEQLREKVTKAANNLKQRIEAEPCDDYSGPVLLSPGAAAGLVNALFVSNLYEPRLPLYEDEAEAMYAQGNLLTSKLGLRIFPSFIEITDDPGARRFDSKPLVGWYTVDDDGLEPEKITLVESGKFVLFPMSRIPNKEFSGSNGHGRGYSGDTVDSSPSNVLVTAKDTMTDDELMAELISYCKDAGLEYGIAIRSFAEPYFGDYDSGWSYYGGEAELSTPALMYKVSTADGSQTPVRDATLEGVTLKALKDIVAAGDKPDVTNVEEDIGPVSIVCPSMLLEEMDLRKLLGEKPKLPYLKHPYFEDRPDTN